MPERLARARQALAAARVIGLRAAAIVAAGVDAELDPDLTPAGRLVVAEAPDLPAPVAALLGSATPLQLLTERLARARGTNPDLIRREDPVYLGGRRRREAPPRPPRPERSRSATARPPASSRTDLELPDERIPHQVDHVEVPRQQVLEHDRPGA